MVNDFQEWVVATYGNIGEVKIAKGDMHEYLGIQLDYSTPKQVTIDMTRYVESMINFFLSDWKNQKFHHHGQKNCFLFQQNIHYYPNVLPSCSIQWLQKAYFCAKEGAQTSPQKSRS